MSASSEASIPGGSAEALTAMSTALLAQQLPPLSKFDGDPGVGENKETIKEWLEQFEMIAEVCRWDSKAKLVNMVTRLRGEAYAFYKSCSLQQRRSYEEMTSALTKRFTPVRIQAVESGLFHERKQRERESADSYAQALRGLFKKAYPSAQRGSPEAESMGRAVLASQFASGLLPAIKSKVAGSDGDLETLLAKARFEEAKLRDLVVKVKTQGHPSATPTSNQPEKFKPAANQQTGSERGQKPAVRCFECGARGHYRDKCPERSRKAPAETPGSDRKGKVGRVANLAPGGTVVESPKGEDQDGVQEALEKAAATMYSILLNTSAKGTRLGPVPTSEVQLEGEQVMALLDTGSPLTIVSLEHLLQVLAKRKPQTQTPEEWRCEVEARLKPTQVDLRSYGGGHLPVVRQIQTVISRNGQEVNAIVQVQRDAPAKLLIGTDLLPHLGFLLVQTEVDGEDVDLLEGSAGVGKEETGEIGTVCLLQAVKLPGQHSKLVRARVTGRKGPCFSLFEPSTELVRDGVTLPEAAVEEDESGCVVVVMENRGYAPVEVKEGQVLGQV